MNNSLDYGGPNATRRGFVIFMIAIAMALAAVFFYVSAAKGQEIILTPVDTIPYCSSSPRITCVVDGDTIWLQGVKLRLKDFDTPEPQTNICGGKTEKALADKASKRLSDLLNTNNWTIETFGKGSRGRRLATIRIAGRDVGDILIEEKLARHWPDGEEFWCI